MLKGTELPEKGMYCMEIDGPEFAYSFCYVVLATCYIKAIDFRKRSVDSSPKCIYRFPVWCYEACDEGGSCRPICSGNEQSCYYVRDVNREYDKGPPRPCKEYVVHRRLLN